MGWESSDVVRFDLCRPPSFKVKQWFTGFGEFSLQWIQICIVSPMHRSSFYYATIAYHVGLNAVLGLPHPGPTS